MRIAASSVEQKEQKSGDLLNVSSSVRAKKNRKRNNKKSMATPVQKLHQTCTQLFSAYEPGTIPPPSDVERLREVLDCMKPSDVGLNPNMSYFKSIQKTKGRPRITYLHLYECDRFSMGIFCFPPSGVIPLHNHPGMTVFSKLLFGSMHIKSYDWVDLPHDIDQPPGVRLSKIKVDADFTAPCNLSILYPNVGNMHCFTALTSCAVLDVLVPPYSDPNGRHCTYYRSLPYNNFPGAMDWVAEDEREGYLWLEKKEEPDDFKVVGATYSGPKVLK